MVPECTRPYVSACITVNFAAYSVGCKSRKIAELLQTGSALLASQMLRNNVCLSVCCSPGEGGSAGLQCAV